MNRNRLSRTLFNNKIKNRYIIVTTNYLTSWLKTRAIPDASANTLAKFIFEEIVCKHGVPKMILSDNRKNFISKTVRILYKKFLIKYIFSFLHHFQTNRIVKRLIQIL